jgi:hypothetical protein
MRVGLALAGSAAEPMRYFAPSSQEDALTLMLEALAGVRAEGSRPFAPEGLLPLSAASGQTYLLLYDAAELRWPADGGAVRPGVFAYLDGERKADGRGAVFSLPALRKG